MNNKTISVQSSEWMKFVPDDTLITRMSIPGSHDTMMYDENMLEKNTPLYNIAITQALTLEEQMESGIRYFDLRFMLDSDSDELITHHAIYQNTRFSCNDVFDKFVNFLKKNSSEALVMRVVFKYDKVNIIKKYVQNIINKNPEFFFKRNSIFSWPTFGEMRGKMLILERDDADGTYEGAFGDRSYPYECYQDICPNGKTMIVQDDYLSDSNSNLWIEKTKLPEVHEYLVKASNSDGKKLIINSLNASGANGDLTDIVDKTTPSFFAKKIVPFVQKDIKQNFINKTLGIISYDTIGLNNSNEILDFSLIYSNNPKK